jgi:hypothetical protein
MIKYISNSSETAKEICPIAVISTSTNMKKVIRRQRRRRAGSAE